MEVAHNCIVDQFRPAAEGEPHLAAWYSQGHSDAFGDRLLMFDNTSAPSWELLRFRPALAHDGRFAAALHDRVEQLRSLNHPDFPVVRNLNKWRDEDGLAVVSTYVSGVRLSEALKKPRSTAFAERLIQHLVPALVALQRHRPGIAHGALNADRIIITPEGRFMVREHMVGKALASLELSRATLWADFGILASPAQGTTPALDARNDVAQLALVALSLMTGRRIGPDEYPHNVGRLIDEIEQRGIASSRPLSVSFRNWLERALQLKEPSFASARDANNALEELRFGRERSDDYFVSFDSTGTRGHDPILNLQEEGNGNARRAPHKFIPKQGGGLDDSPVPALVLVDSSAAEYDAAASMGASTILDRPRVRHAILWMASAIAVIAIGEAAFIGRLLFARAPTPPPPGAVVIESTQPGATVWVDDQQAGVTPFQLKVDGKTRSIRVLPATAAANADQRDAERPVATALKEQPVPINNRSASAAQAPAAPLRSGGFRLISPIEVHVLDGDRVLGSSTDGPIVAPVGQHQFEFVNSAIGYRAQQVVEVKPGQIRSVRVTVPNGTLNINATPWAAVSIDGTSFGETPIGNLSVPAGEHEIVFRHPQLGERRQRATVRADGPTRVSVNLQQ